MIARLCAIVRAFYVFIDLLLGIFSSEQSQNIYLLPLRGIATPRSTSFSILSPTPKIYTSIFFYITANQGGIFLKEKGQ